MKLTILTQYYPPEVGAPQNRLHELALRLNKEGVNVTVLTAMPNYPSMEIHKEFKGKWFCKDKVGDIDVYRSWIYVKDSKVIVSRLLNYFSFVFTSLIYGLFVLRRQDYILVESPPLFLGISAYILSIFKRSKMIFNVSDLWPESAEKLDIINNKQLLGMATVMEEFFYKKSKLVTGQTQGIVENISNRFPNKDVYWLPNGVDFKLFNPDQVERQREKWGWKEGELIIAYAGIIGHAQGLDIILDAAKIVREKYEHVKFILLGSGPEKDRLIERKTQEQIENVEFIDLLPKSAMPTFVRSVDVALVPLKKLDLFLGALPSKIFENLAMQKPLLLGVDGEARELFINQGKSGLFFEPENEKELAKAVYKLCEQPGLIEEFGKNGRKFVFDNFNRDTIAHQFKEKLYQNFG